MDPTEPIDRIEPVELIERMEPVELIDQSEFRGAGTTGDVLSSGGVVVTCPRAPG
jgi:hypothetical protein